MTKLPWTPWQQVVHLRDDLKTGELSLAAFAADLEDAVLLWREGLIAFDELERLVDRVVASCVRHEAGEGIAHVLWPAELLAEALGQGDPPGIEFTW